ncbi:putative zinc finger protein [Kribbella orskensis]|uniref:Zinc finger protein n=1 Tax=Kribbella orskensis TaxID=2512216 RepID=A0ABY2BBY7_9ACTN|nr:MULTISPECIES: zf-HC2 domain-containing protein [Kribbella]TCN34841.1 putative zinc finger protein [Kribbella sp. VKM Ac-2500]TCO15546.1 putative zinc finger protein [Kribbella orskensis]
MTLQHPLDKLSAVVDGELDHDSRDRVLSHLVGCDACRSEVDAQRRLKTRLAATPDPEPSTDLMQRLLGVPSFSPEPREEVRPVLTPAISLSPQRSAFPAARTGATRPGTRTAARSRRRTGVLGAAGSAAAVASLLGTAFVLGDPARQEQPPVLQPPVASFSSDYAAATNGTPFADPVALLNSFNGAGYAGLSPTLQPVALTGR